MSLQVIIIPNENPDIKTLLQLLKNKNYKIYENVYQLNIIADKKSIPKNRR